MMGKIFRGLYDSINEQTGNQQSAQTIHVIVPT